ncbi:hypothetical protein [Microbulbifer litoralis]|uniref:hypothetical protein n=1 Tax=Microbulbifer litoralis TaxID=2933965 RepID=UPI002028411E|nr:hypothetical protein [Microbulbifer sp. GX H0434]
MFSKPEYRFHSILFVFALTVFTTSHSNAQTVEAICTGTEVANYTPGLTLTEQYTEFVATSDFSTCLSGSDPEITSAVIEWSGAGGLSCLSGGSTGSAQVTWNTGETSDFTFSTVVAQRPLGNVIIILDGEIISGKFSGSTMLQEITLLNLNPVACLNDGVETLYGPVQMQITSI